jgi:hypothetical protein
MYTMTEKPTLSFFDYSESHVPTLDLSLQEKSDLLSIIRDDSPIMKAPSKLVNNYRKLESDYKALHPKMGLYDFFTLTVRTSSYLTEKQKTRLIESYNNGRGRSEPPAGLSPYLKNVYETIVRDYRNTISSTLEEFINPFDGTTEYRNSLDEEEKLLQKEKPFQPFHIFCNSQIHQMGLLHLEHKTELIALINERYEKHGLNKAVSSKLFTSKYIEETFQMLRRRYESSLVVDIYTLPGKSPSPPKHNHLDDLPRVEDIKPLNQKELEKVIAETARISATLVTQSIALLTKQFGDNYAKTNPNVLSNVLNTHRSVYLSLQTKTQ